MQYTYWNIISTVQNSFELIDFDTLGASAIFCYTSSTSTKHFPLRTFFLWGNKKRVARGETGWMGWGAQGHDVFGQKLLNPQCGVSRCTPKSPIMKGAEMLKESSKKNSLSQTHNKTSWCNDAYVFLEHSPRGGSLCCPPEDNSGFFVSPALISKFVRCR